MPIAVVVRVISPIIRWTIRSVVRSPEEAEKPIYNEKSTERKDVASKSRSYKPSKQKVNNTKQHSYSSKSNTSKSYQSKGRSVKSNQRSYTSDSQSKSQQKISKSH